MRVISNIKIELSGITGVFELPDLPYALPEGINILIDPP